MDDEGGSSKESIRVSADIAPELIELLTQSGLDFEVVAVSSVSSTYRLVDVSSSLYRNSGKTGADAEESAELDRVEFAPCHDVPGSLFDEVYCPERTLTVNVVVAMVCTEDVFSVLRFAAEPFHQKINRPPYRAGKELRKQRSTHKSI